MVTRHQEFTIVMPSCKQLNGRHLTQYATMWMRNYCRRWYPSAQYALVTWGPRIEYATFMGSAYTQELLMWDATIVFSQE